MGKSVTHIHAGPEDGSRPSAFKRRNPDGVESRGGHPIGSGSHQGQVSRLQAQSFQFGLGHEAGEGAGGSIFPSLHPEQTRGAGLLRQPLQCLDVLPGKGRAPLQKESPDSTAGFHGPPGHGKVQGTEWPGPILDLQGVPEVGPVGAVGLQASW